MNATKPYTCLIYLFFMLPGGILALDKDEMQADPSPVPEAIETGVLEAKPGYVGDVIGAEVTDFDMTSDSMDIIDIMVPVDPDRVDLVRVISPAGSVVKQKKPAQLSPDYQNRSVGVRLYLPKRKNWEFKLRLVDQNANK